MKLPEWEKGYLIRAHVAMKPEPIVMRSGNPSVAFPDDFESFSEVLEIASFDGIVYPSRGRSCIRANPEADSTYFNFDRVYEYVVESVERVSADQRNTWMPVFPPGTSVAGSESRIIAHTREVQLQDFLTRIANTRQHANMNGWLKLLAVIFGVGIQVLLPFFRFMAKRHAIQNGWIISPKITKGIP